MGAGRAAGRPGAEPAALLMDSGAGGWPSGSKESGRKQKKHMLSSPGLKHFKNTSENMKINIKLRFDLSLLLTLC